MKKQHRHRAQGSSRVRIYRATSPSAPFFGEMSCWSPRRKDAEAYLDNGCLGGSALYSAEVEIHRLLDLRNAGIYRGLCETLSLRGDSAEALRDAMASYSYPWEGNSSLREELADRYDAIRYNDDFPEDGDSIVLLRDLLWEQDIEAKEIA